MPKPITKKGYDAAKEKLLSLKKEFEKLPEIIAEAREKGDLKENAEYHAARERQGILQAMIAKLEGDMAETEIVDPASLPKDVITFGKTVKVKDKKTSNIVEYSLVGDLESDSSKGHISVTTPIAKGLMGKKEGEVVTIKVPAGDKVLEILSITLTLI